MMKLSTCRTGIRVALLFALVALAMPELAFASGGGAFGGGAGGVGTVGNGVGPRRQSFQRHPTPHHR
jgi:hypothetical protein